MVSIWLDPAVPNHIKPHRATSSRRRLSPPRCRPGPTFSNSILLMSFLVASSCSRIALLPGSISSAILKSGTAAVGRRMARYDRPRR